MTDNVLFVGQAPGRKPGGPLTGRCGKLLSRMLGVDEQEYESRFRRTNLIKQWPGRRRGSKGDFFPLEPAKREARRILDGGEDRLVLLGAVVAEAFGVRYDPCERRVLPCGAQVLMVPHPSGLNRWWNDPENRAAAAVALRDFCKA